MTVAYLKPPNLVEALAAITAEPGRYRVLAGGTDLIVQWRTGAMRPGGFLDISAISELSEISESQAHIEIGALATHTMIRSHEAVRRHLPALAEACATVGGVQIQNRGTIGGNVMNSSPAGDTLPPLLAHEAEFLAQDLKGERWIKAKDLFVGYRKTSLAEAELLTRIRVPKSDSKERARFYKTGVRRAQAISKVSICVRARVRHGGIEWARIAVGSVAPTVVRAPGTEALLKGQVMTEALIEKARASLADEIAPIDDIRSTAEYRRFAAGGLLARALHEMVGRRTKTKS
jgi:CO/xanthine dehydrogenase FAD-binding subunit